MMKCMVTALASLALASHPRSGRGALERSLRLYRAEQAYIRAIPASTVFGDKLMNQIAAARPNTLKQLMSMKGIGTTRFENYGRDIVRMINLNTKDMKLKPKVRAKPKGERKLRALSAPPRPRPRPRPRPKPRPRPCRKQLSAPVKSEALPVLPDPTPTSIYILELEDDRVYVGSSKNVKRRIAQHQAGTGSAFTRVYKPTGVLLPRLGNVQGDGDAAERDETLRYMHLKGIPMVRGWKFTQVIMPFREFDEAEANIRELFDLCRRCGRPGHFMTRCNATVDRWGRACKE
jgi:predicted GIY-YIG superfamily endonuclease